MGDLFSFSQLMLGIKEAKSLSVNLFVLTTDCTALLRYYFLPEPDVDIHKQVDTSESCQL